MGLTVLDAGVVAGYLDADDAHHEQARAALLTRSGRGDAFRLSTATYAETLVRPLRIGEAEVAKVGRFLRAANVRLVPVDQPIARRAAALRARSGRLRLPDALVLATGAQLGAQEIVTTDQRWPDVGLPVTVLGS